MQDNQQTEHKQGLPWKVVKKTTTYAAAASHRDEVLAGWEKESISDMQIKIRRMNDPEGFTVRTRLDPKVAAEKKKTKATKGKKKPKSKSSSKNDQPKGE
jgi:hypothetical protein